MDQKVYTCNTCCKKSDNLTGWKWCNCDHDLCNGYICSPKCAFHYKWENMHFITEH